MSQSLVSIIIPTYNYAKYVGRAIDSALNQSYPNVEIIVVDDGSIDATQQVLAKYGDKICVVTQTNQGAAAARNRGIDIALGEYISFLDADDMYLVDNIEKKVKYLEANASVYQWCYSNCVWVDTSGEVLRRGDEIKQLMIHLKAEGHVFLQALSGYLLGSNLFLFRREVLTSISGFDEKMKVLEDYDLFLRAAYHYPLGYVDDVLVEIFSHDDSLGNSGKLRGYMSRWYMNAKISRLYPSELTHVKTQWQLIQSDLYRNLAALSFERGYNHRARILLKVSLSYRFWQLGAMVLYLKIFMRCQLA